MGPMVRGQPGLRVLNEAQTRLAVWGDPIAHSRSPQLHAAAYTALERPWTYDRRRVRQVEFGAALSELDGSWRGLSLTMPLKGVAFAAASVLDRRAQVTGAVNTLVLTSDGPHGFNTDVGGIVASLREQGVAFADSARLVGAGATATSALTALAELGARHVEVTARRPEAVETLRRIGERLGVVVVAVPFVADARTPVPVTISTVPGDITLADGIADALSDAGGLLLDVVYGHWPTTLGDAWQRAGHPAVSGLGMLLHQALLQVRAFVTGQVDEPLDDEDEILARMRAALAT